LEQLLETVLNSFNQKDSISFAAVAVLGDLWAEMPRLVKVAELSRLKKVHN
jgi:hypothetical protein